MIPKPKNKYGKTKLIAENLLKKKFKNLKLSLCIGRIFSFTDKLQKPPYVIPSILKKIKSRNNKIIFEDLNNYRDFLSTKDIIIAIDTLLKNKSVGTYNIGSGLNFDLRNIATLFSKKYNKNISFKDTKKSSFLISDNKKLKRLGWIPTKFANKIDYFYQWERLILLYPHITKN